MEVIHLRVAELTKDSRDVGWKQLVRGLIVPSDSREADPLDELAPIDDELVVSKSSSGVFPVTNLDRLLRNLGITTLVMTGTSTGGCVESAVRDAVDLGYDVVVVADGCADATPEGHLRALGADGRRVDPRPDHGRGRGADRIAAERDRAGNGAGSSGSNRICRARPTTPPASRRQALRSDLRAGRPAPAARATTRRCSWSTRHRLTCDPDAGLGRMARERGRVDALAGYYERVGAALAGMGQLLEAAVEPPGCR